MGKRKRKGLETSAIRMAKREIEFREAVASGASVLYHVMHSCGDSVYWDANESAAITLAGYPCPWCGGQTGKTIPEADVKLVCFAGIHARQNEIGACPKHETVGDAIIIRHLADDSCCQGGGFSIN